MFVKVQDNQVVAYPYTVGDLRRDNPNTSFPKTISLATMAEYGMYPVETGSYPAYDGETHRVQLSDLPVLVDGAWELTKTVVALTEEQLQAKADTKEQNVRQERDNLLAETDWWVLPDRTATDEQLAYRQALRDITAQAGFPNDITWPEKP